MIYCNDSTNYGDVKISGALIFSYMINNNYIKYYELIKTNITITMNFYKIIYFNKLLLFS
jgi:hypothetical protein